MKIYYIPAIATAPVAAELPQDLIPVAPLQQVDPTPWYEAAITNAINNSIVVPFKQWCLDMWLGFVQLSMPLCMIGAILGLILYMCGIKKGLSWSMCSLLIYIFIRAIDYMIRIGV